ncbi:Polar organelle development protein [Roseibium album]|nr:Polar organelle development protein [Roseibium album]
MPAWKKTEAGRRGRDVYEGDDYYDAPRREHARHRIERLTRTATALGSGYDPRLADEPDEDLNAVADELDRLLSERGGARPQRASNVNRSVRGEPQRRSHMRDDRDGEVDEIMGALHRLDEQVQGLGSRETYRENRNSRRQPGGYAIDSLDSNADYHDSDDAYYDDVQEDAYGHDRGYGQQPDHYRERGQRARRDASMHIYKDLGRRIDALRAPQEKALNHVREEIGSLKDALGGLSRGTSDTVGRQNTELRRLADMVERLRVDKKNDQLSKDIRKEVADLKTMVGRTNVEGSLQTLEHGYAHILQRLDELSRASVDPRVLRGVTVRLNEIEDAFAALPRSEHMIVLEERVSSIAERMEELLQRKGHEEIEPLRAEIKEVRGFVEQIDIKALVDGIDDRMKFVSSRLDDIEVLAREQRGLNTRLSAMEERMPEPETINRLQGRLEDIVGMMSDDRASPVETEHLSQVDQRLNDIVDRLERMEQKPPLPAADAGAFEGLEKRLEKISGKIDAIEKKTSRPVPVLDAAAMKAGNAPDNKFLTQLHDRLNDLSDRLDQPKDTVTTSDLDKLRQEIGSMRASVAEPVSTKALEQRISDLAQVVSEGADVTDDGRFEDLGAKVAALAEQIESTSTKALTVEQFSPIFERFERGLEQTRSDVAGIAKEAAQQAVAGSPAPKDSQYDESISALQGDLKQLLDAAEGSDERTRNTFDGVKSVLGSLTERLDNLEKIETPGSAPAASISAVAVEEPAPVFTKPQVSKEPSVKQNTQGGVEAGSVEDRARDRKADFIAAARRAAQAATAEAAQIEKTKKVDAAPGTADEVRGKERVGWLRNVLKRDKSKEPVISEERIEPTDDLELTSEDAADMAFEEEDATVLPGDRPAPEVTQASGGRRRAIIYAAVAVALMIGTLQVYRLATGSPEGDQVAANSQDTVETAEVLPAPDNTSASVAPVPAASDPKVVPGSETVPDPVATETVAAPPTAGQVAVDVKAPQVPQVPVAPVSAPQASPTAVSDTMPATSATATLAPEAELAFAPPSGVAGSFGAQDPETATGFQPSETIKPGAESAPSALIANLPPEGVGPMALRSAAASGNPAAEFLIGVKFTEGNGVAADLAKAAVWYQKAADKGLAPAQYRLASLYEKGRGVEKDLPKAKAWYGKAAEAGNAKAMHNLAVLFAEGGGDQPDYAAAAKWFEAAANYGVKDSLFNLGILYAGGIGVDKDLVASYKWFAIAADQGDPEAAKRRDDVANMMDQETLANSRLAVESFKLKTPNAEANKVTMEQGWADSASVPTSTASIKAVDNSAMIREAQDKLNYLGFETGTPDGQMGPRTRSAIRAFQRSLGLPETGSVDGKLIEELKSQAI